MNLIWLVAPICLQEPFVIELFGLSDENEPKCKRNLIAPGGRCGNKIG
jgi:hypothetical protein